MTTDAEAFNEIKRVAGKDSLYDILRAWENMRQAAAANLRMQLGLADLDRDMAAQAEVAQTLADAGLLPAQAAQAVINCLTTQRGAVQEIMRRGSPQ